MPETELGLTGKGVSPPRIPEVDALVEQYVKARDRRMALSERESEAKSKLIDAMHGYADELRRPDGALVYGFDETLVTLERGDEKLKVKTGIEGQ